MVPVTDSGGRGIFVTGTDTGVGKSLVSAALARFLVRQGMRVGVMKPVESGVADLTVLGDDGKLLRWAADCAAPIELISPCRLSEPLAPSLAAELAGTPIDIDGLVSKAKQLLEAYDFVIIEGAGGLMVPLLDTFMVGDLARRIGLPLLTVCRPGLGTINHTLLTLQAARAWGLEPAGLVVNGMPDFPGLAEKHAPAMLAELGCIEVWKVLGQVAGDDRQKVEALSQQFGDGLMELLFR
ncbi:MAG: dethiobiotin synthase [Desulfuromonadales bacterium C00003094]|jgi:dethiobiotin synthetase|nr:MAG: dethiobiotin synthase [Desulfuromonadales bacterium C00003094]OEU76016.1 MAG: dethiobiotin synthase [Desulfuromonadales bacterium C00003107]